MVFIMVSIIVSWYVSYRSHQKEGAVWFDPTQPLRGRDPPSAISHITVS